MELYFSAFVEEPDVPVIVCFHTEDNDEYRGDRICNNAIAAAIATFIVAVVLIPIDLLLPCVDTAVSNLYTCILLT